MTDICALNIAAYRVLLLEREDGAGDGPVGTLACKLSAVLLLGYERLDDRLD